MLFKYLTYLVRFVICCLKYGVINDELYDRIRCSELRKWHFRGSNFKTPYLCAVLECATVRVLGWIRAEDADVKDDVKMAWYIHTWAQHAIFTSSLTSASSIQICLIAIGSVHFWKNGIETVYNLHSYFTSFLPYILVSLFLQAK